jgi:hypothetical protein
VRREERTRKREVGLVEKRRVVFELEKHDERNGEKVGRSKVESGEKVEGHRQQYPVLQHESQKGSTQEELEHQRTRQEAIEWRHKMQRVSAYSEYLRGRASQSARDLVDRSKTGTFGGLGCKESSEDARMAHM